MLTHKINVKNEEYIIFIPCACIPLFVNVVSSGAMMAVVLDQVYGLRSGALSVTAAKMPCSDDGFLN
jgi:hypothetical protein